jgi:hypothetical protein
MLPSAAALDIKSPHDLSYYGGGSTTPDFEVDTHGNLNLGGSNITNAGSIDTGELSGVADHIVTTASELESAFNNLSAGDTVWIGTPSTPYRTTQWLDIDVDGVTVVAQSTHADDGQPIIKVADGANVGGIRMGYNSAVTNVTIRNVGFHGNDQNQDQTVYRLHAFLAVEGSSIRIEDCFATRTSPYHEHNTGGSGVSVEPGCTSVWVRGNEFDDIGDRAIQTAGSWVRISDNDCRNGFDRGVSLDLQEVDTGTQRVAHETVVANNHIHNCNFGSAIGGSVTENDTDLGRWVIANNEMTGTHRTGVKLRSNVSYLQVTGNVGYQASSDKTQPGIQISGSGIGQANVTGNTLVGYTGAGIEMGVSDFVVSGNLLLDAQNNGMDIGGERGTVVGNMVDFPAAHGIRVSAGNTTVANNTVLGAGDHGLLVDGGGDASLYDSNVIRGSNQNGNGTADIHIDNGDNAIIGNVVQKGGPNAISEGTNAADNFYDGNLTDGGWGIQAATSEWGSNSPTIRVDVRNFSPRDAGAEAYHAPSGGGNTEGPAFYDGTDWISLVDGTTIA